jgi:hypothetical protein
MVPKWLTLALLASFAASGPYLRAGTDSSFQYSEKRNEVGDLVGGKSKFRHCWMPSHDPLA